MGSEETLFFGPLQKPGRAKLIVIRGEGGDGVSYALNAREHVAGRSAGVILFTDDQYLSVEHANFYYRDNQLHLKDIGSLNGTFLRIREPRHLSDGEYFSCAQQLLRLNILDERSSFPTDDGTLFYVSPARKERISVDQILEGGYLGASVGSRIGDLTIGREDCDLTIGDDPHLSRRHVKLALQRDGRVLLTDLGSKNGTFVRIRGEVRLGHGDYVSIGKEMLRVEIVE